MLSRRDLQVTMSLLSGLTVTRLKATRDACEPITGRVH